MQFTTCTDVVKRLNIMPWLSCTKVHNDVVANGAMISVSILGSCCDSHGLIDLQTCLQMHYTDSCAAGAGADALSSTQECDI